MINVPKRGDINTRIGVGGGGQNLSRLGHVLKRFAVGFEGIVGGSATLNGETVTPVVFGENEYGELFSDEVGAGESFDLSADTTVRFTVDGALKAEIEFTNADFEDDLAVATVPEIVDAMQSAIETANEADDYWVDQVGSGEEAQIRVFSQNTTMTDNKIEIADGTHENTTLGFDENDVDYGKQALIGVEEMANDAYFIAASLVDNTTDNVSYKEITAEGFELVCSDTSATSTVRILVVGQVS